MNTIRHIAAFATAALLSACGGGGDDAGNGDTTLPTGPGTTGTAAAYAGTWKSDCYETDLIVQASAPNTPLKVTTTLVLTAVNDKQLSFVDITDVYPGTGCTGTPLRTHRNESTVNAVVLDCPATVAAVAADKVTITSGPLGGGIMAGSTITLNGFIYPGDFFSKTEVVKDVLRIANGQLFFGSEDDRGADGYPTAFDADPLTKQ